MQTVDKITVKIPWAENKEDFLDSINHTQWVVTTDNELFYNVMGDEDYKVKDKFLVVGQAPHHTTDWLRFFCNENHPEIDFDKEFETKSPGVFARYQERFGYDYMEGINEAIYQTLKEELDKKGYQLPWS